MGLLNIFSAKNPEDYELKGDKFAQTGAYGKAIVEYERALERLAAWCEGRTGVPFVDACMRALRACRRKASI